MKGRWFDGYLRVSGWDSEYQSVQQLLDHLSRRTKSESSRIQYLQTLATLLPWGTEGNHAKMSSPFSPKRKYPVAGRHRRA